jgi:chemotaxis protein methyltransferase CheR
MLSENDFSYIAREVKARVGFVMTRDMIGPAEARLAPLARREGYAGVPELLSAARTQPTAKLWEIMADALAPSETRFFRDKTLFTALREQILPEINARRGLGQHARILSIGCGAGQEAYSLAMLIEDLRAEGAPGAEITGIDMSERQLDKARSGLYTQFEVQRGLPIRKLIEHFERVGDLWRISDRLRASVRFQQHNLLQDMSGLGAFDLVLCCHVLSGFDTPTRRAVLERIAAITAPDGVLLLGSGETAPDGLDGFTPMGETLGCYQINAAARRAA